MKYVRKSGGNKFISYKWVIDKFEDDNNNSEYLLKFSDIYFRG